MFGLIAVDMFASSPAKVTLAAVTLTVALSVLLHGMTASPLAARYGTYASRLQRGRPEHNQAAPAIATRAVRAMHRPLGSGTSSP